MTYPRRTARRGGFSLTELLVVIGILAVLVGMVSVAVFPALGGSKVKQTRTLLKKLDGVVVQQWSAAMKRAQSQAKTNVPNGVLRMAMPNPTLPTTNATAEDRKRAEVIWAKLQMKAEFPMTYAEAVNPFGGSSYLAGVTHPATQYYQRALGGRTAANKPATEAAACLLLALERPRDGMKFNGEEALGAGALKDTDGDGVKEIVDLFDNPVGFVRWTAPHPEVDGLNVNAKGTLDRDKDDVERSLMQPSWNFPASAGATEFERLCHRIRDGSTPRSWYSEPVIVSAGTGGSADVLYSFKQRQ